MAGAWIGALATSPLRTGDRPEFLLRAQVVLDFARVLVERAAHDAFSHPDLSSMALGRQAAWIDDETHASWPVDGRSMCRDREGILVRFPVRRRELMGVRRPMQPECVVTWLGACGAGQGLHNVMLLPRYWPRACEWAQRTFLGWIGGNGRRSWVDTIIGLAVRGGC